MAEDRRSWRIAAEGDLWGMEPQHAERKATERQPPPRRLWPAMASAAPTGTGARRRAGVTG